MAQFMLLLYDEPQRPGPGRDSEDDHRKIQGLK